MADVYAIFQKFADGTISADFYHEFEGDEKKVKMSELMSEFFYRDKVGLNSRYYRNFKIGVNEVKKEEVCGDGGCKL